jgi:hypothetical protein
MSRQGGKECFHESLVEQGNGRGIGQAKAKESFGHDIHHLEHLERAKPKNL